VRHWLAPALWGAGHIDEADAETQAALKLWPGKQGLWLNRLNFLALTGRVGTAIDFLEDFENNPLGSSPLPLDVASASLQALLTRSERDVRAAVDAHLAARETGSVATFISVRYLAALGAVDPVFDLLDRYYFGPLQPDGTRQPWPPRTMRLTNFLFMPDTAPLRSDPRFAGLTQLLGLDDYWRATGTRPDTHRATKPTPPRSPPAPATRKLPRGSR